MLDPEFRGLWVLIPILALSSAYDMAYRRIPNLIILGGVVASFVFAALGEGSFDWQVPLGGLLGLLLFLLPYAFGKMGAGDVKLLMVCGLFLGPLAVFKTALYAMLAGGLLSLFCLLYQTCAVNSKRILTVPYAVAISMGAIAVIFGY